MFTILWKMPHGTEEVYSTPSVSLIPEARARSNGDHLDCFGRRHVAFQRLTAVEGSEQLKLVRTVIDIGDVYVMNAEGNTVATYRFPATLLSGTSDWQQPSVAFNATSEMPAL